MLFTSGKSPHKAIAEDVYKFFTDLYEIESDVEIYHTDLSDDNATDLRRLMVKNNSSRFTTN